MTTHDAHHGESRRLDRGSDRSDTGASWLVRILMFTLLGVGGYYVIAEHGAHLLAAWPLLFLLACPLMHFMHGRHGGHAQGADTDNTGRS